MVNPKPILLIGVSSSNNTCHHQVEKVRDKLIRKLGGDCTIYLDTNDIAIKDLWQPKLLNTIRHAHAAIILFDENAKGNPKMTIKTQMLFFRKSLANNFQFKSILFNDKESFNNHFGKIKSYGITENELINDCELSVDNLINEMVLFFNSDQIDQLVKGGWIDKFYVILNSISTLDFFAWCTIADLLNINWKEFINDGSITLSDRAQHCLKFCVGQIIHQQESDSEILNSYGFIFSSIPIDETIPNEKIVSIINLFLIKWIRNESISAILQIFHQCRLKDKSQLQPEDGIFAIKMCIKNILIIKLIEHRVMSEFNGILIPINFIPIIERNIELQLISIKKALYEICINDYDLDINNQDYYDEIVTENLNILKMQDTYYYLILEGNYLDCDLIKKLREKFPLITLFLVLLENEQNLSLAKYIIEPIYNNELQNNLRRFKKGLEYRRQKNEWNF